MARGQPTRRRSIPEVTADRKLKKRLTHECLRCAEPALPDSDFCEPHRDDNRKRARDGAKKRRSGLRFKGKCRDCGRRSKKYRCKKCHDLSRKRRQGVKSSDEGVSKDEIWRVDPGTNWQRYRGKGRRGRLTRQEQAEEDKRDLRWAIAKLQAFEPEIDRLVTPSVLELPRIQRQAERRKSASCLDEALRFIEGLQAKYE
jgi:hypothetical protein